MTRARYWKSLMLAVGVALLPVSVFATCLNNCGPEGDCPATGICPNQGNCANQGTEMSCWQQLTPISYSCEACQFHFSCFWDACEAFTQNSISYQNLGCQTGTLYGSDACNPLADHDSGTSCCN
jgi:hypothetical protein